MNHRLTVTAAIASAAASTGLFPLLAGGKWFWAGLGAIIVVAAIGTATRLRAVRALPAAVCLLASLLGLLLYLNLLYSAKSSFLHVFPTGASLAALWRLAGQGMQETQQYAIPVPALRGIVLIATGGIGLVAVLTDLVAVRLRRSALAGLPLLVLFSIPVATGAGKNALSDAVVFCVGMAGYLALLSADGQERLRLWGRLVTPWSAGQDEHAGELGSGPSTRALAASGRRIGLAAVAVALFVPLLVPSLHAQKLFPSSHRGLGVGDGPGAGLAPDPLVLMNRQLQEAKPTVVLTYHTTDPNPQYLQMFVLGTLSDSSWSMQQTGKAVRLGSTGRLPAVPGLPAGKRPSVQTSVSIRTGTLATDVFLPAPYSPRQLTSPGSWLADPGTLMLYNTAQPVSGLHYRVRSLDVSPLPEALAGAPAGAGPMGQYLTVPPSYRSLRAYARQIVKNAATPGAEAIALNNWFISGRFKYSLSVSYPAGAAGIRNFLKTRTGYCQDFAFAMAVLARLVGIPARVVVGYTAGTSTGDGNYVVKTSDAHAWPELYFRGFGWLRMEPTPPGGAIGQGTASAPSYIQSSGSGGTGSGGTGHGTGGTTTPLSGGARHVRGVPDGGPGRRGGLTATSGAGLVPGHGGGGLDVLLLALAAVLAAALVTPRAARSLIRRRRWLTAHTDAARAHAAWFELLDDLADNGVGHDPGETPRAVAKRVAAQFRLAESGRAALLRIAQAEERASYAREAGPSGTLPADVIAVRGAISASVTRSARWRARLLPSSAAERMRQSLSHALDVFGWLEVASARVRGRVARTSTADEG